MALSENRVYPQWNSHLVGIVWSAKPLGLGCTQHFQTNPHHAEELVPSTRKIRASHPPETSSSCRREAAYQCLLHSAHAILNLVNQPTLREPQAMAKLGSNPSKRWSSMYLCIYLDVYTGMYIYIYIYAHRPSQDRIFHIFSACFVSVDFSYSWCMGHTGKKKIQHFRTSTLLAFWCVRWWT